MRMCWPVALAAACAAGCTRTPGGHEPVHVDIYTLAADPGAFMGKRVQVQGYYDDSSEAQVLTPTGMSGPGPSVRIEARAPASLERDASPRAGGAGQVVMEGTVAAGSGRSCVLVDCVVLRSIPIDTTTPPEFRAFVDASEKLNSPDVDEQGQASMWLVEFVGEDLGDTGTVWMEWWRANRHEAYARSVYLAIERKMFAPDATSNVERRPQQR